MGRFNEQCEVNTAMKVLKIIGLVILGIAACFLFGYVIMLLWNWLMPDIFGLKTITYWQSFGILILASILFGRFGGGGSSDHKKKDKSQVKEEIRREIRQEIEKELRKECGETPDSEKNAEYERTYEKWWEEEGKDSFERYARRDDDGAGQ